MKKILSIGVLALLGGVAISSSVTAGVSFITGDDNKNFGIKSKQLIFDVQTCPEGVLETCPAGCTCDNNVSCFGKTAYQVTGAKEGYTYDETSFTCNKIEEVIEESSDDSDKKGTLFRSSQEGTDCDANNYPLISETPGCSLSQDKCVDKNGIQRYTKCQKCTQFKGHLYTTSVQFDRWMCSSPYEALEKGICTDRTYNGLTTSWCNENCGVANSNISTKRNCPDGTQKTYRFRAFSLTCDAEADKKCQTCYERDMIDPYRVLWDGDKPFNCDGTQTAYITAYESCSKYAKYPSSSINIANCQLVYYCDFNGEPLYRCGKCKSGYVDNNTGLCHECNIGDIYYAPDKCSKDYDRSLGSPDGVVIGKTSREYLVLSSDYIVPVGKYAPNWNNWTHYCGNIPSKEEAEVLFEHLDAINAGFAKIGGKKLYTSFWTSTKVTGYGNSNDEVYAWLAVPKAGDGSFEKKLVQAIRTTGYAIRCMHRYRMD